MYSADSFEKMDLFYLGREFDPETFDTTSLPLLYKSKNLTTHAAIIGMTGSGKTGLGIGLIEEAAIDKLPVIIIDPKGDMGNLLLSFPDLAAEDFEPWVDASKAEQRGISKQDLAKQTAKTWEQGLASWGQDRKRIARMRANADFAVYTPGSAAGRPVSVLASLDAPEAAVLADNDIAASLVNSAVSSLLGLLGIKADPLKSREHILLSSIILHYWRLQENISLENLIGAVVSPPFEQVGVFPLNTFYPQEKRMDLAMQLNNILASPAFSGWIQGEPLKIENFLYSKEGKPRISIFSIAHLSDEERMFFVTMLLGRMISWMRQQEGSSSLRCLLYMDEIFGYFPPSANPPSKKPMLLLLKQARAFGIGVVLSTQNPVDIDYKGLSNIGTWFVGRLQTRQDQDRVLSGISGRSKRFDKNRLRRMLAGMRGRTFLMYSAHQDEPILFETRWVLSYLKGPISLGEIGKLTKKPEPEAGVVSAPITVSSAAAGASFSDTPPLLSGRIDQCFVPPPIAAEELQFAPWLAGSASVRFFNQSRGIDETKKICLRLALDDSFNGINWSRAEKYAVNLDKMMDSAPAGSRFNHLPTEITGLKNLRIQAKEFSDHLYHSMHLPLMRVANLKLESRPGESESAFQQRIALFLREKRDLETGKLEESYKKKQRRLEVRLNKAYTRIDKEKSDVTAKSMDTALSFGVAVLGALFGRKPFSVTTASRSARGMRSAGRLLKEKGDVKRAAETAAVLEEDLATLAVELQDKMTILARQFDPAQYTVENFSIHPRRADIFNQQVCLLWEPVFDFSALE